jgi:acetyl esterase
MSYSASLDDYKFSCLRVLPEDFYKHDVENIRHYYQALFHHFPNPGIEHIQKTQYQFDNSDRSGKLKMNIYVPPGDLERDVPIPCIMYAHGGGFISGNIECLDSISRDLSHDLNVAVCAFEYRLAPKHRHPVALEDCLAAYVFVRENTKLFSIDQDKIFFAGESCGGMFAAALPIMLRDRGFPQLAGSIAINPVLDVHRWAQRRVTDCSPDFCDEMFRFTRDYLGDGDHVLPHLASPLLNENYRDLPAIVLWCAKPDPLSEDAVKYAERLERAGTAVHLDVVEYAIHGCLRARHHYKFAREGYDSLLDGIRRVLLPY